MHVTPALQKRRYHNENDEEYENDVDQRRDVNVVLDAPL
jgi:hypothetical protein